MYDYTCTSMYTLDYGLRTSLPKEVKEQMLIVTVLPDISAQWRPLMKALDWAKMSGKIVTIDICPLTSLASEVLNP